MTREAWRAGCAVWRCTFIWQTSSVPERALALGGGAAGLGHLGRDLRAGLGPQVAAAGAANARSSSAPSAAGEHDRLHGAAGLVDLEPQLAALLGARSAASRGRPGPASSSGRSSASYGPPARRSLGAVAVGPRPIVGVAASSADRRAALRRNLTPLLSAVATARGQASRSLQ